MPKDLAAKIGIRLDFAALGLTGLMGIQVDPGYGLDKKDERLFIRVANFGPDSIFLKQGDSVFTFELHQVLGRAYLPKTPKINTWDRLRNMVADEERSSWTYVTRVKSDFKKSSRELKDHLRIETRNLKQSLQPLVLFGIVLVATTLLGVAMSIIVGLRSTPTLEVPGWVTEWAWIILLVTFSAATAATAFVGFAAAMIGIAAAYRTWRGIEK